MAAFATVVVAIFVCGAIVYDRLVVIDEARALRVHTISVLETLNTALDAMVDQETGLRGYLIGGDESFLEPYHRGRDAFVAAMRELRQLSAHGRGQHRRFDELEALAQKWRSEIAEREIALMSKPETRAHARALEGSGAGKAAMDKIRAKAAEIDKVERVILAERSALQRQAFTTAYTVTILGGTASLIIAALMAALLARGITVPITRMTSAMTALAKGDTGIEVPDAGRRDEIGAMAAALQVFRDSIIQRQRAQAELAHASRVATMGQLTASIAHEVNQPIAATVTNAEAALRWMRAPQPDLQEVRQALERIVSDGNRAGEVITRIRSLTRKAPQQRTRFDLNEAIRDVIALSHGEMQRHGVALRTEFAMDLPKVAGDRVQVQQVVLNLVVNAVEAMSGMDDGQRELRIDTRRQGAVGALVAVRDSGPGLDAEAVDRLFEAFYTTKPDGMGMGLAICRSIIEAHGGRLWVKANEPRGAVFQFTLAVEDEETAAVRQLGSPP
jgi:signal transduction histidine kinase